MRESERRRKRKAADRKLDSVCRDIKNGIVKRREWGRCSALLGKFQNTYWPNIEQKKVDSFMADNDCNRCGLCVRHCSVHNLELTETGIAQKSQCVLCYRCVNSCPQKAATVILHAKVRRQYKGIKHEKGTAK